MHTPECFTSYMGYWACEPNYFNAIADALLNERVKGAYRTPIFTGGDATGHATFKPGPWLVIDDKLRADFARAATERLAAATGSKRKEEKAYAMTRGGIAVVPVQDFMMKGQSKYGGTSTVAVRRQLRAARADADVKGVLMFVDSPGGTVAGTQELGDDIRALAAAKPVWAQVDDLAASAALWASSQADKVFANRTAQLGSIGVFGVVRDTSKQAEMAGVKVHVLSTGKFKGAGVPGAPVTEEHLEEAQGMVDNLHEHFVSALASGRHLPRERVDSMADGRMFIAADAQKLGLIDGIQSADATVALMESTLESEAKARTAQARLRISGR